MYAAQFYNRLKDFIKNKIVWVNKLTIFITMAEKVLKIN